MSHFTAKNMNNLFVKAYNAYMNKDYKRAYEYGKNIYEASEEYYGPIHSNTIEALNSLVMYCKEAKKEEEAFYYAKLAYERTQLAYGEKDFKTIKALEILTALNE